jgi:hypothetical protein
MKAVVIAATLVVGHFLTNGTPALAHERSGILLTPAETRAYRACLYTAWVEDNCRIRSGKLGANYDRLYATCVARVVGRFPLDGRRFWYNNDEYCWNLARDLSR